MKKTEIKHPLIGHLFLVKSNIFNPSGFTVSNTEPSINDTIMLLKIETHDYELSDISVPWFYSHGDGLVNHFVFLWKKTYHYHNTLKSIGMVLSNFQLIP